MTRFDEELNRRLAAFREQDLFRELRRVDSAQGPRIRNRRQNVSQFFLQRLSRPRQSSRVEGSRHQSRGKIWRGRGRIAADLRFARAISRTGGSPRRLQRHRSRADFFHRLRRRPRHHRALLGKDDIIILDKLVHACIVDAAKLSGAKIRVFRHNDLNDLEDKLKWAEKNIEHPTSNIQHRTSVLIVTESIFTMDGDPAPLREIVALKEKYGAWLMVDEAHATGVLGKNRRGLAEELGVSGQIEIQMGTLGKALGASGGYICGSRAAD